MVGGLPGTTGFEFRESYCSNIYHLKILSFHVVFCAVMAKKFAKMRDVLALKPVAFLTFTLPSPP